MRTVEEWKRDLSAMPAENLPSFNRWQGSIKDLISHLAQEFAENDVEVEAEVERLEALTPDEYAEDFFHRQFDRLRPRNQWTEYDEGYFAALLQCAVCLGGFGNEDWLTNVVEEGRA